MDPTFDTLHSGNKENQFEGALSEMKKRVKESKDSKETITYHSGRRLRRDFGRRGGGGLPTERRRRR